MMQYQICSCCGKPKRPKQATAKRFPSNTLFSHSLFCQEQGVKRVRGTAAGATRSNSRSVYGEYDKQTTLTGYADTDGYEQVTAWLCDPSCPIFQLDQMSGVSKSGTGNRLRTTPHAGGHGNTMNTGWNGEITEIGYGDQGGVSRYFQCFPPEEMPPYIYQSKPSRKERNQGCEDLPEVAKGSNYGMDGPRPHTASDYHYEAKVTNTHPTVKSTALLKYLTAMICPPGGTVLDCFAGSGTTALACIQNGFNYILIEAEEDYCNIARARIAHAEREVQS